MKVAAIGTTLTLICCLATPRVIAAKGGGHGGGHSGGGHSGGGHSGGGHSAGGHSGGGHSSGGHAAGGKAGGSSHGTASRGGATTPSRAPTPRRAQPPPTNRPRDGHPIVGTAVPRPSTPADVFLSSPSTYAPHFVPPYVVLGLRTSPFGFRHRYTYPVCWSLLDCAFPVTGGFADAPPAPPIEAGIEATGNLRLDVQPMTAQVFVDGYYVGTVEDFVQTLAGLNLQSGPHHLEFRSPGYDTLAVDVQIQPSRTITYRATLTRIP